ncbi:hypothetical protein EVAR_79415_1 [Eumeta japonica]|uniref:Endonuclease/exonuclease/phosphatase domain-containing protein n=1 Tax=Eumeta variegata TaxID=151549 RepID=A0A4C1VGL6_EUMVA|nr:hypothetical protein EVAR_79415_1 [Eumeta japonica]
MSKISIAIPTRYGFRSRTDFDIRAASRSPERFPDPPKVLSSRTAPEPATAIRAMRPRTMPFQGPRPATAPPPPMAQLKMEPQREMPPTILTSKRPPALTSIKAADGGPLNHHGGSGPNPSSAASTAPHPRRTPTNLRVVYWNAGGISGKTQDLRTVRYCGTRAEGCRPWRIGAAGLHKHQDIRNKSGRAGTELRLFAAYRPPGSRFCSFGIHTIFEDHTPTILAGDLNAKHTVWGSRVVSPVGRQLLQDAEDYRYKVLIPDAASYVPADCCFAADVLDIVLCHRLSFPIHV